MQVLKFGGSSVANAANMSKVVDIVTKAVDRDRTILVSSAISGCTDTLIKIDYAREFRASLSAASATTMFAYEISRQNKK